LPFGDGVAAPIGAAVIAGSPVLRALRQAARERLTLGGSGDGRDNKGRRKSCNYKIRI
jgi:hypothetical protein